MEQYFLQYITVLVCHDGDFTSDLVYLFSHIFTKTIPILTLNTDKQVQDPHFLAIIIHVLQTLSQSPFTNTTNSEPGIILFDPGQHND